MSINWWLSVCPSWLLQSCSSKCCNSVCACIEKKGSKNQDKHNWSVASDYIEVTIVCVCVFFIDEFCNRQHDKELKCAIECINFNGYLWFIFWMKKNFFIFFMNIFRYDEHKTRAGCMHVKQLAAGARAPCPNAPRFMMLIEFTFLTAKRLQHSFEVLQM